MNDKLQSEILALLKEHTKPREEIPQPVADYFTEERFEQLAAELVEVMKQYCPLPKTENSEA